MAIKIYKKKNINNFFINIMDKKKYLHIQMASNGGSVRIL